MQIFFFFFCFFFFFFFFFYAAAHYHKISVDYHKISPENKIYFKNYVLNLSDQNAKRSKPQYKVSIVVNHFVKKAATHIVTSHTYATGPPEVRRMYAAGARYVDPCKFALNE